MSDMTDAIVTKLEAVQTAGTFYDDVSGRIYTVQTGQNTDLPKCLITVISDPPLRYFPNADIEALVNIDLWDRFDTGFASLSTTNDKLITLLDEAAITITGFGTSLLYLLDRGIPTVEEDAVRIMTQWRVWGSV